MPQNRAIDSTRAATPPMHDRRGRITPTRVLEGWVHRPRGPPNYETRCNRCKHNSGAAPTKHAERENTIIPGGRKMRVVAFDTKTRAIKFQAHQRCGGTMRRRWGREQQERCTHLERDEVV